MANAPSEQVIEADAPSCFTPDKRLKIAGYGDL